MNVDNKRNQVVEIDITDLIEIILDRKTEDVPSLEVSDV